MNTFIETIANNIYKVAINFLLVTLTFPFAFDIIAPAIGLKSPFGTDIENHVSPMLFITVVMLMIGFLVLLAVQRLVKTDSRETRNFLVLQIFSGGLVMLVLAALNVYF